MYTYTYVHIIMKAYTGNHKREFGISHIRVTHSIKEEFVTYSEQCSNVVCKSSHYVTFLFCSCLVDKSRLIPKYIITDQLTYQL